MSKYDNLILSLIREGNYIDKMHDIVRESKLLMDLSRKDQLIFLDNISFLNNLDRNELTDKEQMIIKDYNNMIEKLLYKCKRKTLSESELKVLLLIMSYFSLNNNSFKDEVINVYFNNYFYNGSAYFLVEELILFNNSIVSFIGKMLNIDAKLDYNKFIDIPFSITRNKDVAEITVSYDLYFELLKLDTISKEDFCYLLVYQCFALLHEFYHSIQFELVMNNKNYDDIERLEKELVILTKNEKFYTKYHNNFKLEKEADSFALKFLKYLLKDVIPLEMFNVSLDKLISQLNDAYDENLDEEEFKKILNDEYKKVKSFSEEIINHLKLK